MKKQKSTPLTPPLSVLIKLRRIVIHCKDVLSPSGRGFFATEQLLGDPEVAQWVKDMNALMPE